MKPATCLIYIVYTFLGVYSLTVYTGAATKQDDPRHVVTVPGHVFTITGLARPLKSQNIAVLMQQNHKRRRTESLMLSTVASINIKEKF